MYVKEFLKQVNSIFFKFDFFLKINYKKYFLNVLNHNLCVYSVFCESINLFFK